MNTQFLSDEAVAAISAIMQAHGIQAFDASVRFWGRGKSIHLSGDVGQRELACLLEIMQYLSEADASESTSSNVSLRPMHEPFEYAAAA